MLTKINLNSVDLLGVPGGRGSLTRQDIMAALGMGNLPEKSYQLGMMIYTGDEAYLQSTGMAVWELAVDLSIKHKWPKAEKGKQQLRWVANVALCEILTQSERVCKHCNGDGLRPIGSKMPQPDGIPATTCPRCLGWGYFHLSENEKALRAGIPKTTWRNGWEDRYKAIHGAINDWVLQVHSHLRRYIGNDDQPLINTHSKPEDQKMTIGYRLGFGRINHFPVLSTEGDTITYQLSSGQHRVEPLHGTNHRWFDTWEKAQRHLINKLHSEAEDIRRRLNSKEKELEEARRLSDKQSSIENG